MAILLNVAIMAHYRKISMFSRQNGQIRLTELQKAQLGN